MSYLNEKGIHGFKDRILKLSGEDVSRCTQCGKCTAGCPISPEMDLQPNQVIHLIQINDPETVLRCRTIWLCASCQTCSARCPDEIDVAQIMDSLRKLAVEEKVSIGEGNGMKFNEFFLDSIRKRGRVNEMEILLRYNLATHQPFKDSHLGLVMLAKRKLSFSNRKIKGVGLIKEIFKNSRRFIKE
ncbi:MAG: 4Fe-4S dicluster domain-containing protein [Thermodesulfobacteriota bacterium]